MVQKTKMCSFIQTEWLRAYKSKNIMILKEFFSLLFITVNMNITDIEKETYGKEKFKYTSR